MCLGQEMDLIHSCDLMTPSSQFMPVVSAVCVGCVFVRSDRDRKSATLLAVCVSVCELHVYCSITRAGKVGHGSLNVCTCVSTGL